jgi:hypothetical protein
VVTEEHEASVVGLWRIGKEIEKCIKIEKKVPWVAILRANYIRTLDGISTEEDRLLRLAGVNFRVRDTTYKVEAYYVVVSFHSVEFNSKSSGIASLIRELSTKSHS